MCFDLDFIFPKIFGLLLCGVWVYYSFREWWLLKQGETVVGKVVDISSNPDFSSPLNIILTIDFSYQGKNVTISRSLSGIKSEVPREIEVYINKKKVERSVIRPRSRFAILSGFLVPVVFSLLILVSFFRLKGC